MVDDQKKVCQMSEEQLISLKNCIDYDLGEAYVQAMKHLEEFREEFL